MPWERTRSAKPCCTPSSSVVECGVEESSCAHMLGAETSISRNAISPTFTAQLRFTRDTLRVASGAPKCHRVDSKSNPAREFSVFIGSFQRSQQLLSRVFGQVWILPANSGNGRIHEVVLDGEPALTFELVQHPPKADFLSSEFLGDGADFGVVVVRA